MRYRIVDVFSDRPLAGNALCVVVDPCPEEHMQAVAREINLSETTFVTEVSNGLYRMRIFTPTSELPFAGHPSLGTAWVLGPGGWVQWTSAGSVAVTADTGGAVMTQPDPQFARTDLERAVAVLGLRGAAGAWYGVARRLGHVYVATDEPLDELVPDLDAVTAFTADLGATGLAVFRRLDDRTLQARVFAPGAGVPEDPGTGSAAGPIGLLALMHLGTGLDVTIRQGDEIGRPCRIEVHAEPGAVTVGGRVAACAEGRFSL